MIQHLHSIICDRSIIDKSTGLASYIDIIEGISLEKSDKYTLPLFLLVSKFWIKDGIKDNLILEVEVSRKKESETKRIPLKHMEFPLDRKGENILIQLEIKNLVLEDAGVWEFDVRWRIKDTGSWKKGAVIPLKVSID